MKNLMNLKRRNETGKSQIKIATEKRRTAILVNSNAKRVTKSFIRKLQLSSAGEDSITLYICNTLDEAKKAYEEISTTPFELLVLAGGDGTIAIALESLTHLYDKSLLSHPKLALLPFGTGNAMSSIYSLSRKKQLLKLDFVEKTDISTNSLKLISDKENLFTFGGFGIDGQVLNDYNELNSKVKNPILKLFTTGPIGYVMAATFMSIPRVLRRGYKINIKVTSNSDFYYIDPQRGDMMIKRAPGIIYEGPALFLGCSSIPCMGSKFKAFPFTGFAPDGFYQLRIANLNPLRVLANLFPFWTGTYRNKKLLDFFVKDIDISLDKAAPYQHSGEAMGHKTKLNLELSKKEFKVLDI